MPGGTAVVTAMLCAFFTLFTGGSGVTILALGGLLLPALLKDGYREKFSLGLLTAAGSLGLLFPPALPLILYGIVAGVAIGDLFVGGLLPGMLMLGADRAARNPRRPGVRQRRGCRSRSGEAAAATWEAKWELMLPVVILGSLLGGATTVQSVSARGALRARRAAVRPSRPEERIRRSCAVVSAFDLARRRHPDHPGGRGRIHDLSDRRAGACADGRMGAGQHPVAVRCSCSALNGFLIIVGGLMDIFSAIVVVVPLIVPIAAHLRSRPGAPRASSSSPTLELGYLTPPVGVNLFLASYRFNKPVLHIARAMLPMLLVLAVGVLLITYVPWLTLGLLR